MTSIEDRPEILKGNQKSPFPDQCMKHNLSCLYTLAVKDLKLECSAYTSKLSAMEAEMAEAIEMKVKHYEDLIGELEVKQAKIGELNKADIERLKAELERVEREKEVLPGNQQKRELQEVEKQLEELRFTCDELRDEKEQLMLMATELKDLKEKNSSKF